MNMHMHSEHSVQVDHSERRKVPLQALRLHQVIRVI